VLQVVLLVVITLHYFSQEFDMDTTMPLVSDLSNDTSTIFSTADSGKVQFKNRAVDLSLSATYLKAVNKANNKVVACVAMDDVIGSSFMKRNEWFILEIFSYPHKNSLLSCCSSKEKLRKKSITTFKFDGSDMSLVNSWSNAINSAAYKMLPLQANEDGSSVVAPKMKRAIVYVNPVGGKGIAKKAWEKVVRPMFVEAGVDVTLIITERRNHAYDHVAALDLSNLDFISTISGDGLIYEVINGLSSRPDGEVALKSIAVCPLPGGSSNGLVKSITYASHDDYSLINAAFIALKGKPSPLDLSLVQTPSSKQLSFLMLGWALISDVDILSEFLRPLGELRMYVAGVYFILAHNLYRGRLSMLLDESDPAYRSNSGSTERSLAPIELPSFDRPVYETTNQSDWLVIDSDFMLVWVVQVSHVASTMYVGPGVQLDDGLFTIFVAENMSRFDLIHLLTVIDTGEHVKHPKVKTYKARAYRLEPLTDKGLYALDGEVVEYGPIQATMKASAARVNILN
jgi:sphingosine kinase